MTHDLLTVPMSPGEILDRMTILDLKTQRIDDPAALRFCELELRLLKSGWYKSKYSGVPIQNELDELLLVNAALWDVEDRLRRYEREQDFGGGFIAAARSVYRWNDQRAAIKSAINHRLGSPLAEVKSYQSAAPPS